MFGEIGDRHAHAWALHNLANARRDRGDLEESLKLHREALQAREDLGDRYGQAFTHEAMAETYRRLGRPGEQRTAAEHALAIFDDLGDPRGEDLRALIDGRS